MARNLLTARQVQTAKAGKHSDGDGLELHVKDNGSASWVFRFTAPTGKRREQGLGVCHRSNITDAGKSLTTARDEAERSRKLLRDKIDPIEHDKALRQKAKAEAEAQKREAQAEQHTVARVARAYYEEIFEPKDKDGNPLPSGYSDKHAKGWINSLEQNVPPTIWYKPIAEVTHEQARAFILMIRRTKPELGKKVTQRLRKVFNVAERKGLCRGNPVAVAAAGIKDDNIKFSHEPVSHIALPYIEVPAFVRDLRQRDAIAAKALLFGIYTMARTNEIIGATWDEIHDLDGSDPRWVLPAERMMKNRKPHTAPLSPSAVAVLRAQRELGSTYVFPSPESIGTATPEPLSNMAMLNLVQKRMKVMGVNEKTLKRGPATPHGICRQSSSTWANDLGIARAEVVEAAQSRAKKDRVAASYNKATYMAERRALLIAWADYVDGKVPASNVVPFAAKAA